MTSRWYYTIDRKAVIGPVALDQLQELATARTLLPTHLVCKEGEQNWIAVGTVPDLIPRQDVVPSRPYAIPVAKQAKSGRFSRVWLRVLIYGTLLVLVLLLTWWLWNNNKRNRESIQKAMDDSIGNQKR